MGDFTLAIGGDVMLGRLLTDALDQRGPEAPWALARPLVEDADAFLYNLECCIASADRPQWEPDAKTFHFRMDPRHLPTLAASGVAAVQIANNHVMDHGEGGLVETLAHLDAAGVPHAGAGLDVDAARAPAILDLPEANARVGLVAAADHPAEWAAGPERPGIFLVDPASDAAVRDVADAVQAARNAGADVVVLGLHWGPNMRRVPPAHFRRFARRAVQAGADVVWGTSAHLFQGIEYHRGRVILYDTGDLLDDYAIDPFERNDLSFLFRVTLDEDGVATGVSLHPTAIADRAVRPATPDEGEYVAERMRMLCEEFGTRVERRDGQVVVAPEGLVEEA